MVIRFLSNIKSNYRCSCVMYMKRSKKINLKSTFTGDLNFEMPGRDILES